MDVSFTFSLVWTIKETDATAVSLKKRKNVWTKENGK
jgi:hypothetical protein